MATERGREDEVGGSSDDDASDLEHSRMPFLAHLRELRDRVRNAAIAFIGGFGVCFFFAERLYRWLREPLFEAWAAKNQELAAAGKKTLGEPSMHFGSLTEPFWVNLSVALWAGIFVASPFIFYQLWRFIAPGLYKRERKITMSFAAASGVMFTSGALFCFYFVLPNLYDFLLDFASYENKPVLMMMAYLDLTREMMLAFGAVFELPLLIFFLSMIGVVTHRGLWRFNRWFVVIAFVIGAVLTPSPDVVSQLMMAGPMIVLYNLSILLAWGVTARRERADAELRERERRADEAERAALAARRRAAAEAAAAASPALPSASEVAPSAPPEAGAPGAEPHPDEPGAVPAEASPGEPPRAPAEAGDAAGDAAGDDRAIGPGSGGPTRAE
jgi:sec-independent protein translocase protein TatC